MPTYEYICQVCKHEWEAEQSMRDAPLTQCPSCHEASAKRLISRASFVLKGGGWYADAYSGASNRGAS